MNRAVRGFSLGAALTLTVCQANQSRDPPVPVSRHPAAPSTVAASDALGAGAAASVAVTPRPLEGPPSSGPTNPHSNSESTPATTTSPTTAAVPRGQWIETSTYRLRIDEMVDCGAAEVGFKVRFEAKAKPVFMSLRDLTLEANGTVLNAKAVVLPGPPSCSPQLAAQAVPARRKIQGFVIFAAPARFRSAIPAYILAYRPTRWGGAGRVEVKISECLPPCEAATPQKTGPSRRQRATNN